MAELAVADGGRGIFSSLKENPKLHAVNDLEAIKLALLPGVSSKAWRRTRSHYAWANSGYVLFMTQRLCSLGGQFTLLTGTGGAQIIEGNVLELYTFAPGTTVVLRLDTAAISDLDGRLSEFRKEGRELAKKVGGANRSGPSLASQILRPRDS